MILSVVVPAYNVEEVLPEFHGRVSVVLTGIGRESEVATSTTAAQIALQTLSMACVKAMYVWLSLILAGTLARIRHDRGIRSCSWRCPCGD